MYPHLPRAQVQRTPAQPVHQHAPGDGTRVHLRVLQIVHTNRAQGRGVAQEHLAVGEVFQLVVPRARRRRRRQRGAVHDDRLPRDVPQARSLAFAVGRDAHARELRGDVLSFRLFLLGFSLRRRALLFLFGKAKLFPREERAGGVGDGLLEGIHGGGARARVVRREEVGRLRDGSLHGDDVGLERVECRAEFIGRPRVGGANRGAMSIHRPFHPCLLRLERCEERSYVFAGVRGGVQLGPARVRLGLTRLLDGVQAVLSSTNGGGAGQGCFVLKGGSGVEIWREIVGDACRGVRLCEMDTRWILRAAHHHLNALSLHLGLATASLVGNRDLGVHDFCLTFQVQCSGGGRFGKEVVSGGISTLRG